MVKRQRGRSFAVTREDEAWLTPLCVSLLTTRGLQERVLEQQMAFAAIPAPTGNESARGEFMQRQLCRTGTLAKVTTDRVGNVRAVIATPHVRHDSAPLVCLAHLDTVYESLSALDGQRAVTLRRDGSRVEGAGIGDNGRGLATMPLLASLLQRPEVHARLVRPVHLVATVGEEGEGNLLGARTWFDDADELGTLPFAALAIDGPGDDTIVHHAVGSSRLRVAVCGPGGHSWVHAGAANPIHALGDFIARATRLGTARSRDAIVAITRMHGGESLTAIPQQAWVDVDLRGTSAARIETVRRELVRLAHQVTPPALQLHITSLGERPAGSLDGEHPLVQAAVRATQAVGGSPRAAVASTDANIPLSRGIPAIAIGAGGSGGGAHTASEWYDDTNGMRGLERLVRLVLSLVAA